MMIKNLLKLNLILEVIISCKKKEKEVEHTEYINVKNIYEYNFEKLFNQIIENVENKIFGNIPKNFSGNIILSNSAIVNFFTPDLTLNSIIFYLLGSSIFKKISKKKIGEKFLKNCKSKLTLNINGLNKNSDPYDNFGTTSKKINLIQKNIVKNYFCDFIHSYYLKKNPSGNFGVIEIDCDKKIKKLPNKYVEIISFSSFHPDQVSGDFSAEIRLGHIYENDKKISFSGGLFSGNIFEILKNVEISTERKLEGNFEGPKKIIFKKGEIIGKKI